MSKKEAKLILKRIKSDPRWSHDIKFIGDKFIEDVVSEFQDCTDERKKENLLLKILDNYGVFRDIWARALSPYTYSDVEEAGHLHDLIIWTAAKKFDFERAKKEKGYAFNAYIVSCLMNALKNNWNSKMSPKNSPHICCPICGETVPFIDEKHLLHEITMVRYEKMFPGYPTLALNGLIKHPVTGKRVRKIEEYKSSIPGDQKYTTEDFFREFPEFTPKPTICPVTGMRVEKVDSSYPSRLLSGYTEEEMINDFPDWDAIITCPFTGKKMLEITDDYLNSKKVRDHRTKLLTFKKDNPRFTFESRNVPVVNPYTGEEVQKLTLQMLAQHGTTLQGHLQLYSTILLDRSYPKGIVCPLSGRKTIKVKRDKLESMGYTSMEFCMAASKYPLERWQVQCAICGEWVDNIWDHLAAVKHTYASSMGIEEYEQAHGKKRNTVTNNSFIEDEEGDSIHISDLAVLFSHDSFEKVDLEDALQNAAEDDLDIRIAKAVRDACNFEDICHLVCTTEKLDLGFPLFGQTRQMKKALKDKAGLTDFDLISMPQNGSAQAEVMTPSKDTIKRRVNRLMEVSGVGTEHEHNPENQRKAGQGVRQKGCRSDRVATA